MELLNDIKSKATLQRGCHDYYEAKLYRWLIFMKVIIIIFSAIAALLAFSDFKLIQNMTGFSSDSIRAFMGIFSFTVFIISILLEALSLNEKHIAHRRAIEEYSKLLREIKHFEIHESQCLEEQKKKESVSEFNDRYAGIARDNIKMRGRGYLNAKKYALKKYGVGKSINTHPYLPLWFLEICSFHGDLKKYFSKENIDM